MNSNFIKTAIALIVTSIVALLLAKIALPMYFGKDSQSDKIEDLEMESQMEIESAAPSVVTANSIDYCIDDLGTTEQVCKQALGVLLDRFPELDLDTIKWSNIPLIYSCFDVTKGIEANFSLERQSLEVEFDSSGSLIEVEYERQPISELPPVVNTALNNYLINNSDKLKAGKKQLSDYKYYELEQTKDNQLLFEFEIDREGDVDITFNDRGIVELNRCED